LHEETNPVCGECGRSPTDTRATRKRNAHGGNRLAFRIWLLLLLALLVLAMPWVQTRVGWRYAEIDSSSITDPRPRTIPLIEPLVRWRDVEAAARGDLAAIERLRSGIKETMPDSISRMDADYATVQFEMIQNSYHEHGSRADMRRYFESDSTGSLSSLLAIRSSSEHEYIGWPYRWSGAYTTRLLDYQEVVSSSNPMGPDPEPTIETEYETHRFWRWDGITASVLFAWWAGWLAGIVLKRLKAKRAWRLGARWAVVLGLLTTSLVLGFRPSVTESNNTFSTAYEAIPSSTDPITRPQAEMMELLEEDGAVQRIAQELLDRHSTLDRPNALVGLIAYNPLKMSSYMLRFGYWGATAASYSQFGHFAIDEEGNMTQVPVQRSPNHRTFHASIHGLSINLLPGSKPNTRYSIGIQFAMVLIWLTGAIVLLRLLELSIRPFYHIIQLRRILHKKCVWCKYPLPQEQDSVETS